MRIVTVVGVLLIIGAVVYLHSNAFRNALERRVASEITRQLGRDCRLRLVSLHPFTLAADVEDLFRT